MKTIVSLVLSVVFLSVCSLGYDAEKPNGSLRLLSYNIRTCRGMDNKLDYSRTAEVINKLSPDVVALQEVDQKTNRVQKVDQIKKLEELTGMHGIFAGAIPYQGGEYGIGMLFREKPLKHEKLPLPGREEKRVLLIVEFRDYVVCGTHLSLKKEDRLESVKLINEAVARYKKPIFLMGDLNAHPGSETIKELGKRWNMLSSDKAPTFPADKPRQTIDYIFINKGKAASYKLLNAKVVDEPVASDHRPIYVDLKKN